MAGGAILAPATGGTSLTVSYASMAYLAADSAYSAFNGHTDDYRKSVIDRGSSMGWY